MKSIKFETKSMNESTLNDAAKELRVNKAYVDLEVIEEKKSILGLNKSYLVEAKVDFDVVTDTIAYLKKIFDDMGIDAMVEAKTDKENHVKFLIESSENPILIGKNGRTLEALQNLIRNYVNVLTDERHMIIVDVGGYKASRKKQLEILATKTAKEVAKTHIEAKLKNMNSYERRIVHMKLSDWRDVTTESEGDEPNRYVVIKPRTKDQ